MYAVSSVLPARRSKRGICYGDVAGWLAGWVAGSLSVTRRYCIKTAKPILKLFRPSGSSSSKYSKKSLYPALFQLLA